MQYLHSYTHMYTRTGLEQAMHALCVVLFQASSSHPEFYCVAVSLLFSCYKRIDVLNWWRMSVCASDVRVCCLPFQHADMRCCNPSPVVLRKWSRHGSTSTSRAAAAEVAKVRMRGRERRGETARKCLWTLRTSSPPMERRSMACRFLRTGELSCPPAVCAEGRREEGGESWLDCNVVNEWMASAASYFIILVEYRKSCAVLCCAVYVNDWRTLCMCCTVLWDLSLSLPIACDEAWCDIR